MRRSIQLYALLTLALGTSPAVAQDTEAIFNGLRPVCVGCHQAGNRAFFASLRGFEGLVVANADLVKPGDPDDSELIRLLEGNGTQAFTQMPIGARSYAQMAADGDPLAPLSMAEIRAWVTGLGAVEVDARPDRDAARVRPMDAVRIQRTLYQQLGLGFDDFFGVGDYYGISTINSAGDDQYPILVPDDFPGLPGGARAETDAQGMERFFALGGGSITERVRPNSEVGSSYVLTLNQVAQAWCRFAVDREPSPALFPDGGDRDGDEAAVKAVIRSWHMHFWAVSPDDAGVDAVYDQVYAPLALGILPGDPGMGDPPAVEVGNCCTPHDAPGCDVPEIEACVCAEEDGYCCNNPWDQECVGHVANCAGFEGACGAGPGGAPDLVTGYIGVCSYFIRHPNWVFF